MLFCHSFSSLYADQLAWIPRADAERAASMVPVGSFVRHFCAPCGDASAAVMDVYEVGVVPAGGAGLWEVQINGEGIDLAYTYVETDGGWQNLGLMLGLDATDVPRRLDEPALDNPVEELQAAEEELAQLEAALAGSTPAAAKRLEWIRRSWQRYRDAQADLEVELTGTAEAGTRARLRLSKNRIAELRALLELDPQTPSGKQ